MGFLKPKWQNPDAEIALQAVEGITNDKILLKIVKTSKSEKVRAAALKKISNDSYPSIVQLAMTYFIPYSDISQTAVRRLMEMEPKFISGTKDRVLELVAKKTKDLDVIEIIASQDICPNARKCAEDKLIAIASGALVDIPEESGVELRRAWACEKISDENILLALLTEKPSDRIKLSITRRIKELKSRD